jgi:hypothetical protein
MVSQAVFPVQSPQSTETHITDACASMLLFISPGMPTPAQEVIELRVMQRDCSTLRYRRINQIVSFRSLPSSGSLHLCYL